MLSLASVLSASAQNGSFEVVSVKPSAQARNMSQTGFEPNRLFAYGVNLKQLIEWAYDVTDIQLSGGECGAKGFSGCDVLFPFLPG